jgi:NAD(P)-dependent dehydrogenase (short-subunit alcohol dehydrogenase family)
MIVGASRGIGLEFARQYASAGWRVHATTRTPTQPGVLGTLSGNVVLHGLEVRCATQISALTAAIADEGIDVFIHNAGVSDRRMRRDEVMAINAEAPIKVAQAFLTAIQRSTEKKLVLMTSQLGARYGSRRSLGIYGDSKAALNDAFRSLAPAWGEAGVIAIVMHPGWVRTDMGGASAPLSVTASVTGMRQVIAGLTAAAHGRFWTWNGREHPW